MKVPLTTTDFLDRAAGVYPDGVAAVDEPAAVDSLGTLTYAELAARCRALAAGLDELGWTRATGSRSCRTTPPGCSSCCTPFRRTAGSSSPSTSGCSRPRSSYIVEHSGASMLLVDPELDDALGTVTAKHRFVLGRGSDDALLRPDRQPRPWHADEDATATINYTSGTTARPKGVQMTHRNIWVNAVTFGWHAGVSDRDVYLHTLPMFHANGWGMPFTAAGAGVPQVVLRKVDGAEILRRIDQHGVTFLCAAPAVVSAVLTAAETWSGEIPGRGRVRVICAGAPPPSKTIERIEAELGWEFMQIYGLTETSPLLTINRRRMEEDELPPADRARRLSRAGMPALGVRLRVSNAGEVLAQSNVVLEGYWQQPEATADALEGGWFHTGDGGYLDDEGYLTISDRKKDIIITGGENVSSIEVEDRLYQHPAVAEVAVIGVPDEKWGETVKAVVVVKPGEQVDGDGLIAFCKEGLARYKAPTSVDFVDAIPRTATGKVQKFKLREPYWEGRDRQVN